MERRKSQRIVLGAGDSDDSDHDRTWKRRGILFHPVGEHSVGGFALLDFPVGGLEGHDKEEMALQREERAIPVLFVGPLLEESQC